LGVLLNEAPVLDDSLDAVLQYLDLLQRVPVDNDQIGELPCRLKIKTIS
jgi:hypothetical protein